MDERICAHEGCDKPSKVGIGSDTKWYCLEHYAAVLKTIRSMFETLAGKEHWG